MPIDFSKYRKRTPQSSSPPVTSSSSFDRFRKTTPTATATPAPISTPPPPERSTVGKAWDWMTRGLLRGKADEFADYATTPKLNEPRWQAMAKGFLGGAAQGAADELTSPLGIATTVLPAIKPIQRISKFLKPAAEVAEALPAGWVGKAPKIVSEMDAAITPKLLKRASRPATAAVKAAEQPALDLRMPNAVYEGAESALPDLLKPGARGPILEPVGELPRKVRPAIDQLAAKYRKPPTPTPTPAASVAEEVATAIPKPKLSAPDVSGMLKGRQILSERLGLSKLKPGMSDELDRMGVEYRRTVTALQEAKAAGDATEVGRLNQATKELGARLRKAQKSGVADESGAVSSALLAHLGGSVAGGVVGGAADNEHPLRGAAIGAVAGGLAPALARVSRPGLDKVLDTAQDIRVAAALSGPETITRVAGGAGSGWLSGLAERALTGRFKDAGRMVGSLPSSLKAGAVALRQGAAGRAGQSTGYLKSLTDIPRRAINAIDTVASKSLQAGGYTADEAANLSLSGEPTSEVGKWAVNNFRDRKRDTRGAQMGKRLLRFAMPFPNVGVQAVERAIERTPIVGEVAHHAFPKAINKGTTIGQRLVRQATGAGAGYAGYQMANEQLPEKIEGPLGTEFRTRDTAAAMMGPNALTFAPWEAYRRSKLRETDPESNVVSSVTEQLPLIGEVDLASLAPSKIGAQFVPNILKTVARATDPVTGTNRERVTRGEPFGTLRAKIPGLREGLPTKRKPKPRRRRP